MRRSIRSSAMYDLGIVGATVCCIRVYLQTVCQSGGTVAATFPLGTNMQIRMSDLKFAIAIGIVLIINCYFTEAGKAGRKCTHDDDCEENYVCRATGNCQASNCPKFCRFCNCTSNDYCEFTSNGFTCNCPPEWTGQYCETDVDECALGTDNCPDPSTGGTCTNTPGGFSCFCCDGYTPTGAYPVQCTGINECDDSRVCHYYATCSDLDPVCHANGTTTGDKFECTCRRGYKGDGRWDGTGCQIDSHYCGIYYYPYYPYYRRRCCPGYYGYYCNYPY